MNISAARGTFSKTACFLPSGGGIGEPPGSGFNVHSVRVYKHIVYKHSVHSAVCSFSECTVCSFSCLFIQFIGCSSVWSQPFFRENGKTIYGWVYIERHSMVAFDDRILDDPIRIP